MIKSNKFLPFTLLLLIIALFCIGLKSAYLFTSDDAYITLRYAQHFAEGYGIVWNIGQAPLEGYSNFSYVLLASLFYYFHLPTNIIIEIIRAFSLFSFILTLFMMYRTMRLWVSPALSLLPIILLLAYPGTLFWVVSGLETPFFMLLIINTIYYLLKHRYGLAGLFMAIAGLTRPEAPLFFIIFGIILSYNIFKNNHTKAKNTLFTGLIFKPLLSYILTFTALYLPYFLWRLYYFGHLFPNSVYCKFLNNPHPFSLVFEYLLLAGPLFILSIPAWLIKKPHDFLYYLILPGFACFFMLYGVDPIMGVFNRYALPFLMLLTMSCVLGCHQIILQLPEKFKKDYYSVLFVFSIPFTLIISSQCISQNSFHTIHEMSVSYHLKTKMRIELSQWLDKNIQKNKNNVKNASIVIGDCGIIPAYLNYRDIVDSLCLNSREMTSPLIQQFYPKFVDWILADKKPTYIIFATYQWNKNNWAYPFDKVITKDQRFNENYYPIKKFSLDYSYIPYYYTIYQKKQENTR